MPYAVTISDLNSSSLSKYPSIPRFISTHDQMTTISSLSSSPGAPKTQQAIEYPTTSTTTATDTAPNKNHSKVSTFSFSKLSASPSSQTSSSSWSVETTSSSSSLNSGKEYYCNCKKSQCLKKYCICFQNKKHCSIKCYCKGCQNIPKHGHQFENKDDIKLHSRNESDTTTCHCRKSNCLKKYCVCITKGKLCTESCRCTEATCKNRGNESSSTAQKNKKEEQNKDNIKLHSRNESDTTTCHCRKSNCLKKYCGCITKGKLCTESCRCTEARCKNRGNESSTTAQKNKKKEQTLWCNCRSSKCQNKYCVCFVAGQACGIKCQCVDCQNGTCTRDDDAHESLQNILGDSGSRQRDERRKTKRFYRHNSQDFISSANIYPVHNMFDHIDRKNMIQQQIITSNNNTPKKFLISNKPRTKLKRKLFEDFTLDADEKSRKEMMKDEGTTKNIAHECSFVAVVDSDPFILPCKGKNDDCSQLLPPTPIGPVSPITTPKQKSKQSESLSFRSISSEISFTKKKSQVENGIKDNKIETDKLHTSVDDKLELLQTSACQIRSSNNLQKTKPMSNTKSSDQDTPELNFDDVVEFDDFRLQQEEQNSSKLCNSLPKRRDPEQTVTLIQKSKRETPASLVSLIESTPEEKHTKKGNDNNNNINSEPNITGEDDIETMSTNINQERNSNLENIVIEHGNFNLQEVEQDSESCRSLPRPSNPTQTVTSIQRSKRKTLAPLVSSCKNDNPLKKTKIQKENDENNINIKVSIRTVEDRNETLSTKNVSQKRESNLENNHLPSGAENANPNIINKRQSKRLKFKTATHSLHPNPQSLDDRHRHHPYPNKDDWMYPLKIKRTRINKSFSLRPNNNAPLEKRHLTFDGDNTIELSATLTDRDYRLYATYRGSNATWKTLAPCDLGRYDSPQKNKQRRQRQLIKPRHVVQFKTFIFRNSPARYFHLSPSSIDRRGNGRRTICRRRDISIIDATSDDNGTYLTPDARRLLLPYARRWFDFKTVTTTSKRRRGGETTNFDNGNVDAVYADDDGLHYVLRSDLVFEKNEPVELVVNPPIVVINDETTTMTATASSSSSREIHNVARCDDADAIIVNDIGAPRHPHMTYWHQIWGMTERHVVDILNYILEWLLPWKDDDDDDGDATSVFRRLRWTLEQLDSYCRTSHSLARDEELAAKLRNVSRIVRSIAEKREMTNDDDGTNDDARKYVGWAVRKEMDEYGFVYGFVEDRYSLKKNRMYRYKIGLKDGSEIDMTEDEVEKYCIPPSYLG